MNTNLVSPLLIILLVALVLFTIFGIFYLYITAKSKERLALIEKGMNPNLARSDFWIQIAIIGGGFCAGLIVGDALPTKFGYGPLIGIILAGAGLFIFNTRRKRS